MPVLKRVKVATVSENLPSSSNPPPITSHIVNVQSNQHSVLKNFIRQPQQNLEHLSFASNGDQPLHSTPPEDPRISSREPSITINSNSFIGQTGHCIFN